ncbi:MAG: hypothetical protein QXP36_06420 [Conexivisphaerales archaeon]
MMTQEEFEKMRKQEIEEIKRRVLNLGTDRLGKDILVEAQLAFIDVVRHPDENPYLNLYEMPDTGTSFSLKLYVVNYRDRATGNFLLRYFVPAEIMRDPYFDHKTETHHPSKKVVSGYLISPPEPSYKETYKDVGIDINMNSPYPNALFGHYFDIVLQRSTPIYISGFSWVVQKPFEIKVDPIGNFVFAEAVDIAMTANYNTMLGNLSLLSEEDKTRFKTLKDLKDYLADFKNKTPMELACDYVDEYRAIKTIKEIYEAEHGMYTDVVAQNYARIQKEYPYTNMLRYKKYTEAYVSFIKEVANVASDLLIAFDSAKANIQGFEEMMNEYVKKIEESEAGKT